MAKLKAKAVHKARAKYHKYQTDPIGYSRDVLNVTWWEKQQEIANALLEPPYRALVKASHNVGKTHFGGGLVNWFFDSFPNSITLTTAPSDRQVKDLLWKEVRVQRGMRGGFPGPKMPRLEAGPDYFAHGYTASDSNTFQGHHAQNMLFIFDEAVGVESEFWTAAEGMYGGEGHYWLCIFNPTDTASQAYQEELTGKWNVVSISMLEHPNVIAELQGEPPPFPAAIRLARVNDLVDSWCTPTDDPKPTDIEWPPGSGRYYRPGPIAESRMLGRWPSQAFGAVWSDALWNVAEQTTLSTGDNIPRIGCDVARFGDDFTEMHVRCGPVSLHHEAHNGWGTDQTAGRLKAMAREWGHKFGVDGKAHVIVNIDDDGVGGGVWDQRGEYKFKPVSAASNAFDREGYPNRRSELWFAVAERASEGNLSLAKLPKNVLRELKRQAMAPKWKMDNQGRRVVEPKDKTKEKLGRSPDGIDALDLAYAPPRERPPKRRTRSTVNM